MADEVPAQAEIAAPAPPAAIESTADAPAASSAAEKPEGEVVKPAETEEDRERKRKGYLERNLSKAIRREAEAKARADLLERQLQELKPKPAPQEGAPKLENFSDIEEYATAKAEYAKAEALKEHTAKQQTEAHSRELERIKSSWEEKADRGREKYDDFDKLVGDIEPNTPLMASIMEAENGDDIAHYLGKTPQEARRIMALNPWQQAREIGKLEAKLAAEPPKPKTPSGAPAPIKPLGAAASPAAKKLTEMSYEEFEKKRKAQIAARR